MTSSTTSSSGADAPTTGGAAVTSARPAGPSSSPRGLEGSDGWRTPLLTADDEVRLATSIEAGLLARELLDQRADGGTGDAGWWSGVHATDEELHQLVLEGRRAWQVFHTSNAGLVLSAVRDVCHGIDDDLVQQGWVALGEAVRRYDMRLGFRFSTFALHWVRNAVLTEHRRRANPLSVSDARLRNLALVAAVRAEIGEQGRTEDVALVAQRLDRPEDWVRRHWTRAVRLAPDIADLEALLSDTGAVRPPADAEDGPDLWWLAGLPEAERAVLVLRYGVGGRRAISCAEIARRWRRPPADVRALHRRALTHARELAVGGAAGHGMEDDGVAGAHRSGSAAPTAPLTMGWLGLAG